MCEIFHHAPFFGGFRLTTKWQAGVASAVMAVVTHGLRRRTALSGPRVAWDFVKRLDTVIRPTALASDPETVLLRTIQVGGRFCEL